jgi:CRP-like cAMP-binding protein
MDAGLLDRLAFLEGFSAEQVEFLSPFMDHVEYQSGETIFGQGDPADFLYFIIEGRVSIQFKPEDGPVLKVANLEEGGVFGWSSALGSAFYTSSAIAIDEGIYVRLAGEDLKTLCQDHAETGILILNKLAGVIAQRLRSTHEQVVALLQQGLNQDIPGGCA